MVNVLHESILSAASQPQCNMIIIGGKIQFNYEKDMEFKKIYEMFKEQNTLVRDNVRVNRLICIPKQDKKTVLKACHDEERHMRGNKLVERVKKSFY
jgi:hypothetical protein